jgi:epoxyqueuosine reductase
VAADLANEIKTFARRTLGFDLVGITTAAPLPGASHLARWVAAGTHGDMAYMAETVALRGEPTALLPGARSVVCVAMSYHGAPDGADPTDPAEPAVVARYARRKDYHKVIKTRLTRLGRFLSSLAPESRWRTAVDTAPLLEKELAQRAGLGWIGKNTCLINRRLGSELLLGELLTTLELQPDAPETDHCGTCTACLKSCPTRAFVGPYRLDARRCISYATIEHRGALPRELLPSLGGRVFGCDTCQEVCPWNRRAAPACAVPLAERPHLGHLSVSDLERLDAGGWAALAGGTPLRRLDFPRLRRNLEALRGHGGPPAERGPSPGRESRSTGPEGAPRHGPR